MTEPNRTAPRLARTTLAVLGMALFACSGTDGSPAENGVGGNGSTGGRTATEPGHVSGGEVAIGGSSAAAGGSTGAGGSSTLGGAPSSGGVETTGGGASTTRTAVSGGSTATGGTRATGGAKATGGALVTGGALATGGAAGTGGNPASGGTRASGGTKATGGTAQAGGTGGASGTNCPYTGHVSYTLATVANPSTTEQNAYTLIRAAMDKAVTYYNCYTNITKSLNISYVPSVSTADGNINGSIRFGSNTSYMDYRTAMHEISHTVGIGTASKWASCVDMTNKLYTCSNAKQQLTTINSQLTTPVDTTLHADSQHFWPYGINQQSEVKSEADLVYHCQMVMAMLKDLA